MTSLFLLIPLAVVLVAVAGVAFAWAVRSGQFENLEVEGTRILFDDDERSSADENPQER